MGIHTISVKVTPSTPDILNENNRFSKIVDVGDKPRVMIVTNRKTQPPLVQVLNRSYDYVIAPNANSYTDYSAYEMVFLDNLNASFFSEETVAALRQYVIDGNGLVVVGGDNSFERGAYRNYHPSKPYSLCFR